MVGATLGLLRFCWLFRSASRLITTTPEESRSSMKPTRSGPLILWQVRLWNPIELEFVKFSEAMSTSDWNGQG